LLRPVIIALHPTRIELSSERLVMGGHSVPLREESGLDRRMPFVECPSPEQTLTLPT